MLFFLWHRQYRPRVISANTQETMIDCSSLICLHIYLFHHSIINYATHSHMKSDLYEGNKLLVKSMQTALREAFGIQPFLVFTNNFLVLLFSAPVALHCRLPIGRLRLIISSFPFSLRSLIFSYPQAFCGDISSY